MLSAKVTLNSFLSFSFKITLTTGILDFLLDMVNMSLQIYMLCSFIVTLVA